MFAGTKVVQCKFPFNFLNYKNLKLQKLRRTVIMKRLEVLNVNVRQHSMKENFTAKLVRIFTGALSPAACHRRPIIGGLSVEACHSWPVISRKHGPLTLSSSSTRSRDSTSNDSSRAHRSPGRCAERSDDLRSPDSDEPAESRRDREAFGGR